MKALRQLCDFGALSAAERLVVSELDTGEPIVVGDGSTPAAGAGERARVRAAFLRYLLLDAHDDLRLQGTRLHEKGLRLVGASVEGTLDLENCVVECDLEFRNCRFDGTPVLAGAQVQGLCFKGSVLPGLKADWIVARGPLSLDGVESRGEIRLIGAKIRGQLDCDDCRLANPGKTALTLARADIGAAFFLRGSASIDGLLNLSGARLRAIVDRPECWPKAGNLNLSGCLYDAFLTPTPIAERLRWLRLQRAPCLAEFSPQPFEQCALVLQQSGHGDDARAVLMEKERLLRRAERSRTPAPIRQVKWLRDALLGATIRYGYAPMLAVAWLLGFWILGTAFSAFVYEHHAFKPGVSLLRRPEWMACASTPEVSVHAASLHVALSGRAEAGESQLQCFLRQPESRSYTPFNAAMYSLDTLLPVVSLGVDDYWSPDATRPWGALGQACVWAQTILGWALTFLAVAGFSGLVKTR